MKILENLWQVGGAEYTTVEDAALYLVRFGIYHGKDKVRRFIQAYL
jgi:hypothetical protein